MVSSFQRSLIERFHCACNITDSLACARAYIAFSRPKTSSPSTCTCNVLPHVHVLSSTVFIVVIHTKVTTSQDLDFMAFVHNLGELTRVVTYTVKRHYCAREKIIRIRQNSPSRNLRNFNLCILAFHAL